MTFSQSIKSVTSNFTNFSGRASRSELWYWILFVIVSLIILNVVETVMFIGSGGFAQMANIFALIIIIPSISVSVRRLHDINFSGWWMLVSLTIIGDLIIIFLHCLKGDEKENRFGPNPLSIK